MNTSSPSPWVPASLLRICCFLNARGMKVRPWLGPRAVLAAFRDAPKSQERDDTFWTDLRTLLANLSRDMQVRAEAQGWAATQDLFDADIDHVIILGERHLRHVLKAYCFSYFNTCRPHQGIRQRIPAPTSRAVFDDTATVISISATRRPPSRLPSGRLRSWMGEVATTGVPERTLEHYKRIESLTQVVLIAHDERRMDVWTRGGDTWAVRTYRGDDAAELPLFGCKLPLPAVFLDPLG